jgi:hypothetical protein
MHEILNETRFDFISAENKAFLLAFDAQMTRLGYDFGGQIGGGACWGRYMVIYRRTGVKSKDVYARVYIRDTSLVLRLFLNQVDRHRGYIEGSPACIQEVFTGPYADCEHCQNEKQGVCKFRKSYTLQGRFIEKCNGKTFEFFEPTIEKMDGYIGLFTEFYPQKKVSH